MSSKTLPLDNALHQYLIDHSLRESDLQGRLREETSMMENAGMQISPEQGQFMALLVKLMGARRALEIGTFTGYSALAVALALPEDGTLVACDQSREWTNIGRRYWQEAGVAHKIDLRLGLAAGTLQALLDEGQVGTFDFAFIDADKGSYPTYYGYCLQLVRQGGLIALDNAFMSGSVADEDNHTPMTTAIREITKHIHHDDRVDISLVPIGDGLLLARVR